MKNIMGIIYTGERDDQLRELTANRAVAAVPFAGRYRLIDFPLSAMVNSGIRNVGVIAQKNYNSLMDHLGSGREWDLHGKRSGLVLLPPFLTKENVGVYSGFLDALHSNLHYLRRSKERYVVVTDTHMLFNARFDDFVAAHEASGADITLMYTADPSARRNGLGRYLQVEEDGRVTGLEIDPTIPRLPCTYLETMCIRRELLITLVDQSVSRGEYHLTRGLLMNGIYNGTLNIHGFENPGRAWQFDSVQSYFDCSMEMLHSETRRNLFSPDRPVLTKLRDEMPARYISGAHVKNSLIADGCIIEGTVENSILFRGVRVEKGATVRNSIIMQDGFVQTGAELLHCILDKQVTIQKRTRLIGPRTYPIVLAKGLTV
ncbi:MAG: glucose-1-phosphate adenylyltransferase subunit GlgD [Clostridiales bacterium]|nr:glucose-1-phosphate adenylyltransferase subunit GlgD [Clostridiales bacterium]